jgi:import inner membrane translocase subunit TIM22
LLQRSTCLRRQMQQRLRAHSRWSHGAARSFSGQILRIYPPSSAQLWALGCCGRLRRRRPATPAWPQPLQRLRLLSPSSSVSEPSLPAAARRPQPSHMFSTAAGPGGGLQPQYRTSYDIWKPAFPPRAPAERHMGAVVDSCFNKAALGLVAGGGGGFLFGIVLGAMPGAQMDSMDQTQKAERVTGMRPKARLYFGETISKAKGMGRTFAGFSILYGGSEGVIEKYRGKHDLMNAVAGGAFTGAAMAWRSGPGAMAGGAVFIGAFSFAIDYYMESYSMEEVYKLSW